MLRTVGGEDDGEEGDQVVVSGPTQPFMRFTEAETLTID